MLCSLSWGIERASPPQAWSRPEFPSLLWIRCCFAPYDFYALGLLPTLAFVGQPTAALHAEDSAAAAAHQQESAAVDFMQSFCVECHQGAEPEAGLNLAGFASARNVVDAIETWKAIRFFFIAEHMLLR